MFLAHALARLSSALAVLCCLTSLALAQKSGGTLNLIVQPEPQTINLGINRLGPTSFVGSKIYEGLITFTPKLEPKPALAESWSISPDGLTYTFNLRKGVTWHDGKPFTSADALFSFQKFLPAVFFRSKLVLSEAESITAPDEHTIVFKLKAPFPGFMQIFEATGGTIMPAHLYEGVTDFRNAPANQQFIGTGPFKVGEWRRGSFVRLVKNDNYWDKGKPYLKEIYFHIIPDANSRSIAFETGKVDVLRAGDVENFDISRLASEPGVELTEAGWEFLQPIGYLHLNNRRKPFSDVRARQAVAHAIDRKFIIETIFGGFGREINGPFYSSKPYRDASAETKYEFDVEKAKKLLDEAGLKPGPGGIRAEVELVPLPYGEMWQRQAEYVREALGAVGIKANIASVDVAGWSQRLTTFNYDIGHNFLYTFGDASIGINQTYLSVKGDNTGTTGGNVHGYSNAEVDDILVKAAHENDPETRAKLYSRFQQIVTKELPLLWTHEMVFPTVFRKKVRNLTLTGLGTNENFADVWIDQ
ncbi:ABC transporter substrate-binding protein [Bradyrhizobium sp. LHD-71]|uniref:ABC transporter substrate-binding protein n=1 Tax=Bradyrhizobium sp. LHD-71 TaxID=3072141 RepID=UPI00280ED03A|nr:ABC transporter substrate-binding protein [Bradyrhizobium sp. LHD-71]MDQ8731582.1 ABC transporter substrate-binding protein [Bradyrhizobium sp. LHD-71]